MVSAPGAPDGPDASVVVSGPGGPTTVVVSGPGAPPVVGASEGPAVVVGPGSVKYSNIR